MGTISLADTVRPHWSYRRFLGYVHLHSSHHEIRFFYQLSNLLSVTVGISNNFFWNARFNFKKWDSLLVRFLSFYMIGIIGLLISAGLLFIFVGLLHVPVVLSKVMTFIFVALCQFVLNKRISFRTIRKTAP